MSTVNQNPWLKLFAALFVLKFLLYLVDPQVMFFLGDSHSYLNTAVNGGAPPDRSYYYGLFIRVVTLLGGSLNAVVIVQVLLSTLSAFFSAIILVQIFNVRFAIGAMTALLTSVEPIQLLYERYVMTEAVSLFLFVLFLYFFLSTTLKKDRKLDLLCCVVLGFLLLKFRTAYLPGVLFCFLVVAAVPFLSSPKPKTNSNGPISSSSIIRKLTPAVFIFILFFLLHSATKLIQTRYEQLPSHSETGFFILSSWSPLLKNNIIPFGPDLNTLLDRMPCDLANINHRNAQRWLDDCLIDRLRKSFNDDNQTNGYTVKASGYLLLHDPLGVIGLGVKTYGQFFDLNRLDITATGDRGYERELSIDFRLFIKDNFGLNTTEYQKETTLTGRYYQKAKLWYIFILIFPLLLLGLLIGLKRHRFPLLLLTTIYCIQLAIVIFLATITCIRHLQPMAWLVLLFCGLTADHFFLIYKKAETEPE